MYFRAYVNVGAASDASFMHTLLRGVEATKLLNHNELRLNIWTSDTEITVIMANYGRAQSLLQHCMKTKADTREKEPLISRLLMICEPQSFISAALISSLFTVGLLLDTLVQFLALVWGFKTLSKDWKKRVWGVQTMHPCLLWTTYVGVKIKFAWTYD